MVPSPCPVFFFQDVKILKSGGTADFGSHLVIIFLKKVSFAVALDELQHHC